jgi:hypothetical protein
MKRTLIGLLSVSTVVLAMTAAGQANKTIPASEAIHHVGEQAKVCGIVESGRYVSTSRGKPTFLNIGKAYPNTEFTVVIWSENRAKFGQPEDSFLHKHICVSGHIELYKGKPEVVATNAGQITVE